MLRTTRTEFYHPSSVPDEPGRRHNEEDVLAFEAWGYFEAVSAFKAATVYGDGMVKSWRWLGKLPLGASPDTNWVLKAEVDNAWREFRVTNLQHNLAWSIDLTEVQ